MDVTQNNNELQRNFRDDLEFTEGTAVIYGIHGRCTVTGVEFRKIGEKSIPFYKLEIYRPIAPKTKRDTAIWIPVESAKKRGLRQLMPEEIVEKAINILTSREYFFSLHEKIHQIQPKLDVCIQEEGGIGLAKVVSYLYTLKNRQIVPTNEVLKLYETHSRILFREIAEIRSSTIRIIEDQVARGMKSKLLPDS